MAEIVRNGSYTYGIKVPENFKKHLVVLAYHQVSKNFWTHSRVVLNENDLFIEMRVYSYPSGIIAVIRIGEQDFAFCDISHGKWHGSYGIRCQYSVSQLHRMGVWFDIEKSMDLIQALDVSTNNTDKILQTAKL